MEKKIKQGKEKQSFLHQPTLNYVYGRRMNGTWAGNLFLDHWNGQKTQTSGFQAILQPKYMGYWRYWQVRSTAGRVVDHTGPCEMCGCRRNRLVCGKQAS